MARDGGQIMTTSSCLMLWQLMPFLRAMFLAWSKVAGQRLFGAHKIAWQVR